MSWMTVTREQKVAKFYKAADKKPFNKLDAFDHSMLDNVLEETKELEEAVHEYLDKPNETTRANLCKEWADVQVVLSSLAWYFDIPADAAFNRVHNNNMTKVVGGKIKRAANGKILKPEGYVKADMRGL